MKEKGKPVMKFLPFKEILDFRDFCLLHVEMLICPRHKEEKSTTNQDCYLINFLYLNNSINKR